MINVLMNGSAADVVIDSVAAVQVRATAEFEDERSRRFTTVEIETKLRPLRVFDDWY